MSKKSKLYDVKKVYVFFIVRNCTYRGGKYSIPVERTIVYREACPRSDQGLFKLVTLDRILNRITGVTSGCWWLVVNAIPISDICQINQQNISSRSVINNPIKKFS
jgi:hypothetical protein